MKQSRGNPSTVAKRIRTTASAERTDVAERIVAFLEQRHPLKTAEHVSAETGIKVATVASWIGRGSAPSIPALLLLVGAYDADVLCAAFDDPPAWLVSAARQQERERIEGQIEALRAQIEGPTR